MNLQLVFEAGKSRQEPGRMIEQNLVFALLLFSITGGDRDPLHTAGKKDQFQ